MRNSEMPAMPLIREDGHPLRASSVAFYDHQLVLGFTKREEVLKDFMCAMLSDSNRDMYARDLAKEAAVYVDAYFKELEKWQQN